MALRLWASSAANALKISSSGARAAAPAYSISRYITTVIDGLKYTSSHEWVKNDGSVATIGISDHAQVNKQHPLHASSYANPVSVIIAGCRAISGRWCSWSCRRPAMKVSQGGASRQRGEVKATSDVNSPISGEVPSSPAELEGLLDSAKYTKHCEEEDAH
ncbi:hypothetical protein ZWY2020_024614 [Hordeum vulgare]|nr:hypothetical protein ZWY2020_024614 [Hordeum vulgare]